MFGDRRFCEKFGLMYWCGAWAKKKGFWDVYTDILMSIWDDLRTSGVSFGLNKGESYVHLTNEEFKLVSQQIDHISHLSSTNIDKVPPQEFVEPDSID